MTTIRGAAVYAVFRTHQALCDTFLPPPKEQENTDMPKLSPKKLAAHAAVKTAIAAPPGTNEAEMREAAASTSAAPPSPAATSAPAPTAPEAPVSEAAKDAASAAYDREVEASLAARPIEAPASPAAPSTPAGPATRAPAPKAPRALKTDGIVYRVKALVFEKPDASVADLMAALRAEGFKKPSENTVAAFRSDFIHSMRFVRSRGIEIPGVEA